MATKTEATTKAATSKKTATTRATPARKRTGTRARRATVRTPEHHEIAERAYYIHLEDGVSDPFGNWLRAERELMAA